MANYLNDTQELEEELNQVGSGNEYNDLDFDRKLRQAHERMVALVGRFFVERRFIQFEDETSVDLEFESYESLDKVVNVNGEGNEIIDVSNYTEDLSTGTISFTQSYVDDNFFEGLVLQVYAVPTIFKNLELDLAVRNIMELESVATTDGVTNTQVDRLNQRISSKVANINRRNTTGVQSGDNKNRGSQFPRMFGGE